MKKKSLMALVLCGALLATSYQSVSATTSSTRNSLNSVKNEIDSLENEKSEAENQLSSAEETMANLMIKMSELEGQMEAKQGEIEQAQLDLAEAQEKQETQYEDMKVRIRYMYENGNKSILATLLEAESFSDLLNKVEYINQVYDYDRNLLTEYEETTQEIADLEASLEEEMDNLTLMQADYEDEAAELDAIVAELKSQVSDYEEQIAAAEEKAAAYERQIAAENAASSSSNSGSSSSSSSSSGSGGETLENGSGTSTSENVDGDLNPSQSTSVSGSDVVAYARQFIGNPYVWGGTDPNTGADCSGFTQYVMAHFGISIPRTSAVQARAGQEVSYANAQPGDLIFYAYANGVVHHVALYAGGGRIIHARGSAYGIREDSATYNTIYCVRRVL